MHVFACFLPLMVWGCTIGSGVILPYTGADEPPACDNSDPETQDTEPEPYTGGGGDLTHSAETVSFDWYRRRGGDERQALRAGAALGGR